MPGTVPAAAARPGDTIKTTPRNPIIRPRMPLTRIGSSGRNIGARTITNSGTVALRMAASALSTDCSAQVIRANGIVMLMMLITIRWPYTRRSRGSGVRVMRSTIHRNAAPMSSRSAISVNVPNESTASLMKRYDDPHMKPSARKMTHSKRVAGVVIRSSYSLGLLGYVKFPRAITPRRTRVLARPVASPPTGEDRLSVEQTDADPQPDDRDRQDDDRQQHIAGCTDQ